MAISLRKYAKIIQYANDIMIFKKAIVQSNTILGEAEYNNLPARIKDHYGSYEAFVNDKKEKGRITRLAVKDKLVQLHAALDTESMFSIIDKLQYRDELQTLINSIRID